MLSSGAHAVPSSACLKSQLRCVLLGLRQAAPPRLPCRPFHTSAVSNQEVLDQIGEAPPRDDKSLIRRVAAHGEGHRDYALRSFAGTSRDATSEHRVADADEATLYRHYGTEGNKAHVGAGLSVAEEPDVAAQSRSDLGKKTKPLYRHYSPEGRIIGKGKRRQRQSSTALETSTKLDDSPFKVVLLQDLPEDTQKRLAASEAPILQQDEAGRTFVSAADIQAELNSVPDQKDVEASIDALRPVSTILEEKQYSELVQTLVRGYSTSQLKEYRDVRLRATASTPDDSTPDTLHKVGRNRPETPPWLPGTTPLHTRRVKHSQSMAQSAALHKKQKMANDILRRTWNVSIASEEQAIGELEFSLAYGRTSLLLQPDATGESAYKAMIGSKLTIESSRVEYYAPDNMLRVTARQRDAESIAETLQQMSNRLITHVVGVKALRNLPAAGSRGSSETVAMNSNDLDVIGQRTRCHLHQQSGGNIVIVSHSHRAAMEARRLVVALLASPETRVDSMRTEALLEPSRCKSLITLPLVGTTALHYKYRGRRLNRVILPEYKHRQAGRLTTAAITLKSAKLSASASTAKSRTILQKMAETRQIPSRQRSDPLTTYWEQNDASLMPWESRMGLCLDYDVDHQPSGRNKAIAGTKAAHAPAVHRIFSHQVPKLATALSYFVPREHSPGSAGNESGNTNATSNEPRSTIVAHFIPSPFAASANVSLPRIEMTLARGAKSGKQTLSLHGMRAIAHTKVVDVPCPAHLVDVRLTRERSISSVIDRAWEESEIRSFVQPLDAAFRAGEVLTGKPEVIFALPPSPGGKTAKQRKPKKEAGVKEPDAEKASRATYLFERLESRQTTHFVPNPDVLDGSIQVNPAVERCLAPFRPGILLRYAEVDAGFIGGQRTEVSLVVDPAHEPVKPSQDTTDATAAEAASAAKDTDGSSMNEHLLDATSALIELVTLANRGGFEGLKMPRKVQDWDADVAEPEM